VNVQIVVASFHENLSWARDVSRLACPFTIMNCGGGARWWKLTRDNRNKYAVESGPVSSENCQNSGKEAGMYLQYLIRRYDELSQRTLFLQADLGVSAFVGSVPKPKLASGLLETITAIQSSEDMIGNIGVRLELLPNRLGPFPPKDHPVFKHLLADIDTPPEQSIAGHVGAQFWVDRSLVHQFPKSYYEKIYDLRKSTYLAHDLEYVWPSVFQQLEKKNTP